MRNLLIYGAVPLGFTTDFMDSEGSEIYMDIMHCRDLRSHNGLPPLPDVILSNTPPPSPLRRAHSYHFLFPEKADDDHNRPPLSTTLHRAFSVLPTPPPTPTSPQEGKERSSSSSPKGEEEEPPRRREDPDVHSARASLGHIQEVRRRNLSQFQPHQSLPLLTWEPPRIQRSKRMSPPANAEGEASFREQEDRGGRRGGDGDVSPESSEQRLRQIGTDLRRIADQFQVDHGKVASKKGSDPSLIWTVPAAFSKCLSVSLLCLVWWRLLNRLH